MAALQDSALHSKGAEFHSYLAPLLDQSYMMDDFQLALYDLISTVYTVHFLQNSLKIANAHNSGPQNGINPFALLIRVPMRACSNTYPANRQIFGNSY